jgi:hypothetical protein
MAQLVPPGNACMTMRTSEQSTTATRKLALMVSQRCSREVAQRLQALISD